MKKTLKIVTSEFNALLDAYAAADCNIAQIYERDFADHVLRETEFKRISLFSNREINAAKRQTVASDSKLTKFQSSIKCDNQTTAIELSLEEFRTMSEHLAFVRKLRSDVDEKRIKRHMKHLDTKYAQTCKMIVKKENHKISFCYKLLKELDA